MNNCFTFVYHTLKSNGFNIPSEWRGFTNEDMKYFVENEKALLESKMHYYFFESFAEEVKAANKFDVVLSDSFVGIALSKGKFWLWSEVINRPIIKAIKPEYKIMRVKNG